MLPVRLITGGVRLLAQVEVVQGHRGRHRARDHGESGGGGEGGQGGDPRPRVRHHAAISLAGPGADAEIILTVRTWENWLDL